MEVFYGGKEQADDVIARLARPGDTVVTADRELLARCRVKGASGSTPGDFLASLRKPKSPPGTEKPSPDQADLEFWLERFQKDRRK